MSRIRAIVRRPAAVSGLLPVVHLRRRLDELEVDLGEARRHEQLLEREVARIEATVARVAARRASEQSHP